MFRAQNKIRLEWSPSFAYGIGLLASDGCLSKDRRHIIFSSKEDEMIVNFKVSLGLKNKTTRHARGGEKNKKYLMVTFGDINFYKFLNNIGLHSAKSRTIKSVFVPDKYFADFLRGLFDGDGSFYTYWDKRWPNSFGYNLSFASASQNFINWLKERLANLYGVKGYFHKGTGVTNLEYVKGDSKKLYEIMYYKTGILYLNRKYTKVKTALDKDKQFGLPSLQKHRNAVVA